MQSINITCLRC